MRIRGRVAVAGLAALTLAASACSHQPRPPASPSPSTSAGRVTTATVGANGGSASLDDVTITMPAGSATVGQTLTVRSSSATPSTRAASVLHALSPVVDVSLTGGAQPSKPVSVRARVADGQKLPTDNARLQLLSRDGRTGAWSFTPATYDPIAHTLTATVTHFSLFGFVQVAVSSITGTFLDVFRSAFDVGAARPDCSGMPLTVDGVTYTVPARFRAQGDGIVWPCLTQSAGGISVALTNATGLPWTIRSLPKATVTGHGTVDINKAALQALYTEFLAGGRLSQSLLTPGEATTYTFPATALPATIQYKLDAGAHLALTLIWAVRFALDLFYPQAEVQQLLDNADTLSCLGDAIAAVSSATFDASAAGSAVKAVISCMGQVVKDLDGVFFGVVKVVLAALGGGLTLVVNDVIGIVRSLNGGDHGRVDVGLSVPTLALTAHALGPVPLGTAGAAAERELTAILGEPRAKDGPLCDLGLDSGHLRTLTWGGLTAYLTSDDAAGRHSTLTGWSLDGPGSTVPVHLPFRVTVGGTLHQLQAADPRTTLHDWAGSERVAVDSTGVQYNFEDADLGKRVAVVSSDMPVCE
jgi:hypothetical protein